MESLRAEAARIDRFLRRQEVVQVTGVCTENSDTDVMVMQSTEEGI